MDVLLELAEKARRAERRIVLPEADDPRVADALKELQALIAANRALAHEATEIELDPELRDHLQGLGYLDGSSE